jgi:uncharacterized membrane protein YgcG
MNSKQNTRAMGLSLSISGILLFSLYTIAGIDSLAQSQIFPNSIFASSSQAQLHELLLKATEENGQTNSVPGFSIDLTNVISVPSNSELAILTTDGALSINEAKVKSTANNFIDLVKQSQNTFSLAGIPSGVYTVDVIAQKGNSRAAYEGILVLGQEPNNVQTRTIIEQQIDKQDNDGNNGNGSKGNCDPSYPDVCIRPFPPDLDCRDIQHRDFKVRPPDPHDFDREGDGIGCESGTVRVGNIGQDGNETLPPRDPCLDNPTLPECPDPCIENPDAEGCPIPLPPIDPCEEDPSLSGCQEEDTGDDSETEDENDEGTNGGDEGGGDEGGGDEGGGDEGGGDEGGGDGLFG